MPKTAETNHDVHCAIFFTKWACCIIDTMNGVFTAARSDRYKKEEWKTFRGSNAVVDVSKDYGQ